MKKKKGTLKLIIITIFVIAVCIFLAVIAGKKDETKVITSISDICRGTTITEENVNSLFAVKKADSELYPLNAVISMQDVIGKTFIYDIAGKTIITDGMLADGDSTGIPMNNPVITGIRAADISQFVGGIIRKGDYIDISVTDKNTGKCINVMNNIYVAGAYNSDGTEINGPDGCAMLLNVLVEKESEQLLNTMLAMGNVRICRLERRGNG